MPAANIKTKEIDKSLRVNSVEGIYNSIVIPAIKGPVDVPTMISSETDLLNYFTPKGRIEVGYNLGYYSALSVLQKTNKLWVTRVANQSLYGGVFVNEEGASTNSSQVEEISAEQDEIEFTASGMVDGGTEITASVLNTGIPADLDARNITIDGVGTFSVTDVTGSVLTIDPAISTNFSFTGDGAGTIAETEDYVSFDVDFGGSGAVTTATISNLSNSEAVTSISGDVILVDDNSTFFEVTIVSNVDGLLTFDEITVTNANSIGHVGAPEITFVVADITDGVADITISGLLPVYYDMDSDIDSLTASISAVMSDASTTTFNNIITSVTTGVATLDSVVNNPSVIDSADAVAPYIYATATGIVDIDAVDQSGSTAPFILTSANQGDWAKDLRIEIITGKEVKLDGAFMVKIFWKENLNNPLEYFTLSRTEGAKNGYGRNMFIDTALESSQYIRGFSNALVAEDVLPEETVTRDINGNIIARSFITIVAGDDGVAVTDSNMIAAADLMNNKNSYPLSVILDGGWTTPAYQTRLVEIAELRDDCVAVLSIPYEAEDTTDYANEIVAYRQNSLLVNSSYAGLYSPHVLITDKYNDRKIYVAPDGYAAAAINYSASNYEIWYPAAGYRRGRINVEDIKLRFKEGDLDLLVDAGINPIRFYPGKGLAIWGQKTLSATPSSLDRLNVRLLLNTIKPAISDSLEGYLFELNSVAVRNLIVIQINDYLSGIQARNGIYDYYTVCDESNNSSSDIDNHVLNVDVFVKPVQSIEFINFTTIITSTGVDFKLL